MGLIALVCFVAVAISVPYAYRATRAPRGEPVAAVEIVQPDKDAPESAWVDPHVRVSADEIASAEEQMASLLDADDSLSTLLTWDGAFETILTPVTLDGIDSSDPMAGIWQTLPAEAQFVARNAGAFAEGTLGGGGFSGGSAGGAGGGGAGGGGGPESASADSETSSDGSDGEGGDGVASDRTTAGQSGSASSENGARTPTPGSGASSSSPGGASSSPGSSAANGSLGGGNGSLPGSGSVLPGGGGLRSLDSSASAASGGPVSVPEPASLLLAALGFSLMASKLQNRTGR